MTPEEIRDANNSENWHPQDYSGRNYPMPPLPHWITDHGDNYFTIDIDAAKAAGEAIPIDLSRIRQFDCFFTNPPAKKGTIDFKSTTNTLLPNTDNTVK